MARFKFTTDQQKYNIMALKLLNKILVYNLYYFSTINLRVRFAGESSYQIRTVYMKLIFRR